LLDLRIVLNVRSPCRESTRKESQKHQTSSSPKITKKPVIIYEPIIIAEEENGIPVIEVDNADF